MSAAAARPSSLAHPNDGLKLNALQARLLSRIVDAQDNHPEGWVPMRVRLLGAEFNCNKCSITVALKALLKANVVERRVVWVEHPAHFPGRRCGASMANEYRLVDCGGCR